MEAGGLVMRPMIHPPHSNAEVWFPQVNSAHGASNQRERLKASCWKLSQGNCIYKFPQTRSRDGVHERWSRTRLASAASAWPPLSLEIQSLSGTAHLSEEGLFFSRYDPRLLALPQRRSCNAAHAGRFNVLRGSSEGFQHAINRWVATVLHLDPMLQPASAIGPISMLGVHAPVRGRATREKSRPVALAGAR
jgi:hypothetical protein